MRIAIFSDVHGNLTALDAVLAHMDQQEPADVVVFAGDLCLMGPRPAACMARIRERPIASIYGNTDEWILQPPPLHDEMSQEERQKWSHIHALCDWTKEQLGEMGLAWLSVLPFHRCISPTVYAKDDILIVHANPLDVNQIIFPPTDEQQDRYGRVRQSDVELTPLLANIATGILAFGHLHIPFIRQWGEIRLVNVSSVSMPGDNDPRAKYTLFTWQEGSGWSIDHHRVDYSVEAEIEAYLDLKPPGWDTAVGQLKNHGPLPQKV